MAEQCLPPVPEKVYKDINAAIEHPDLRELTAASRHEGVYTEDGFQVPDAAWGPPEVKQLVFGWFVTRSEYGMMKLLSVYFDLFEGRHLQLKANGEIYSVGERLTQAGIALGVLYYIRVLGHEAVINGFDVRDASPGIMAHLKSIMESIPMLASKAEMQHYAQAHAWLLFLGAFAEERWKLKGYRSPPYHDQPGHLPHATNMTRWWFQEHLAEHVVEARDKEWIKATTWSHYRGIFRSFQIADWVKPPGDTWFDRVIAEREASHQHSR
jgi:hypothetical protein